MLRCDACLKTFDEVFAINDFSLCYRCIQSGCLSQFAGFMVHKQETNAQNESDHAMCYKCQQNNGCGALRANGVDRFEPRAR